MLDSDLPIAVPITDSLDLHTFAPRDVKAVIEEYLAEAFRLAIPMVRVIHGRGIGVQRELVRQLLEKSPVVIEFWDAPDERGGRGATLATLAVGLKA